ncbi:MAG: class B sortase [Ruminococcus sp.]|jgi:SrtB family sortase|nr:class B sortase [Ruminococcus sp.]
MQDFLKKLIPQKTDTPSELRRKIILISASVLLLACIIALVIILSGQERDRELNTDLAERHTTTVNVITTTTAATTVTETEAVTTAPPPPPLVVLPEMQGFLDENLDTAGWIKVDTGVDNVVMQTADNEKYLDETFDGHYSEAGTIFADFRGVVNDYNNAQADNIVLYGHNQRDTTMFGTLKKYKTTRVNPTGFEFYKEHPTFTFSNLYENYTYKIVAIFIIEVEPYQNPTGEIFDYHNYIIFTSPEVSEYTFDNWVEKITAHSAIDTNVDMAPGDRFMTLSTCSNEFEPSRLVVVGRRVREGESPEVDTSKAAINPDAIEPDLDFIYKN